MGALAPPRIGTPLPSAVHTNSSPSFSLGGVGCASQNSSAAVAASRWLRSRVCTDWVKRRIRARAALTVA